MMKVLQNVEIIMIGYEVYYNYNGTLHTKEQFEDTYFPHIDTPSKQREEIDPLFDEDGNICVKLYKGDYVKFDFFNEYNREIEGEGIITVANHDDSDRMCDCYAVKTNNDLSETFIIYGRDISGAWR